VSLTNSTAEEPVGATSEAASGEAVLSGPGPGGSEAAGVRGSSEGERAAPAESPSFWTVFADLAALTKPGITRLVVFTTGAGYVLATGVEADIVRLFHTVFGAALASAGANALNMWWERESDAAMNRTKKRPLPAGRIAPKLALVFALLISAWGLLHLALFVNLPTLAIVATSLLSYILVYTPLKRRTHHATLIGALPGSLPTLAGWTAANEPIGATALAITGVVFFWQMPHFYALVWVYREDYARGGHRMLTAVDPEGTRLGLESSVYSVLLLAVSVVPIVTGMMAWVYGIGAVALGLAMVVLSVRLWMQRDNQRAWHLFFGSITYLPVLLVLMLIDRLVV
jgi:protoheme IX farnesyltransferase